MFCLWRWMVCTFSLRFPGVQHSSDPKTKAVQLRRFCRMMQIVSGHENQTENKILIPRVTQTVVTDITAKFNIE